MSQGVAIQRVWEKAREASRQLQQRAAEARQPRAASQPTSEAPDAAPQAAEQPDAPQEP